MSDIESINQHQRFRAAMERPIGRQSHDRHRLLRALRYPFHHDVDLEILPIESANHDDKPETYRFNAAGWIPPEDLNHETD